MQTPLELYESQLYLVTDVCADPWFVDQLALSRCGDEGALRRICGSCLRLVLDIAKKRWRPESNLDLLAMVQDGNDTLMQTAKRFTGSTAKQFLEELTAKIESWNTLLLQHPGWAQN